MLLHIEKIISREHTYTTVCHKPVQQKSQHCTNIHYNIVVQYVMLIVPGNRLACVQRVHKPVDLWDITFLYPQISRLL